MSRCLASLQVLRLLLEGKQKCSLFSSHLTEKVSKVTSQSPSLSSTDFEQALATIGFLHVLLFWEQLREIAQESVTCLGHLMSPQQYLAGTWLGQSPRLQDQRNMEETGNWGEDAAKPEVPLLTSAKTEIPLLTSLSFCWLAHAWRMHHWYVSL